MINLTIHHNGRPIWFNPNRIIYVDYSPDKDATDITIGNNEGDLVRVTESPETVARLITEYKQRQMRLQAAYAVQYSDTGSYSITDFIDQLESEDRGE